MRTGCHYKSAILKLCLSDLPLGHFCEMTLDLMSCHRICVAPPGVTELNSCENISKSWGKYEQMLLNYVIFEIKTIHEGYAMS